MENLRSIVRSQSVRGKPMPSIAISKYEDPCMPNGLNYPECPYMGKRFHEEDGRCLHPKTGDVYYCASHHILGFPPCPLGTKTDALKAAICRT